MADHLAPDTFHGRRIYARELEVLTVNLARIAYPPADEWGTWSDDAEQPPVPTYILTLATAGAGNIARAMGR